MNDKSNKQEPTECTGTARATHEISEYEMLEFDYDENVALSVTTKAFQRHDPSITKQDIKSTIKVIRAARSGKVSVAAERQHLEDKANVAAESIIKELQTSKVNE